MKLYCVRHGEAEASEASPERLLTQQGRQGVERVAQYLKRREITVAHVLHSTKERAKQTADIFASTLMPNETMECQALLDEDANIQELVTMIPAWSEDTMLVGHLPFMPELISALLIGGTQYYPIVNYPPATVVCLSRYDRARWIIDWVLHPKLVG